MVKVASKQAGLRVKSANPSFEYEFAEADMGIEMPEEHANKILLNDTFYIIS